MNIFVVHRDPAIAARMLCDQHVSKMTLETAQILSTVHGSAPYRPTHKHHKCVRWAGASLANWNWLVAHGLALADEFRYWRDKHHASEAVIRWCSEHAPKFHSVELTPFALAMPEEYRQPDPVESYRAFYRADKAPFATWTRCDPPSWWSV